MPNIVPTARYYPKLSQVITVDDLPEFLSFVQNGLNSIFDKIYFKNLQYSKSVNGDEAFYSLEVVSKKMAIALPFDMALVLNPDTTGNDNKISSFPITLEYQWEILGFLKTFNLDNFSFSLEDFYLLGLKVFRITEEMVLAHIMNNFVNNDPTTSKFQQVVGDINSIYQLSPPLVLPVAQESIGGLTSAINSRADLNKTVSLTLFGIYILDSEDLEDSKQKLQQFYNIVVPEGIENYIKKLIIPKAKATLALSAGIEFPKTILKPVNNNGTIDNIPATTKTTFIFAEAQLYVDTQEGIGYQLELAGTLYPTFAEIGNTGILLQIESLKLDLSKKTNIPEADADGRPADFTGVYARAISITLPARWFHDDAVQGTATTTLRLGGYDLLLGTGGISGTIAIETIASVITGGDIFYFENKFKIKFPIKVLQKNATTNVVEELPVANIEILKTYLFPNGAANIPPCPIKFPLTVYEPDIATGVVKTFDSLSSYQQYLNSFPTDNELNPTPTFWKRIGGENGFRIGFNKFDITFKQNKVVHSQITASLEIPKLKNGDGSSPFRATVNGHLDDNGDFNISASFVEPGIVAKIGNFVSFNFTSLELGKQDNDFYIGTSVKVGFPSGLMHTLIGDQEIVIPKIRFYDNGRFEIIGGNGFLPINITLPLGPVKMAVTGIHIGSLQREYRGNMRKYNYIGFDGSISINPLGISARGNGLKYYYTTDDDEYNGDGDGHSFLHIKTIEIDVVVPNESPTFTLHGMLSIPEPGVSQEYVGEVSFKSTKSKLAGYGGIKFAPKFPAFLIDLEATLPKPIPIGAISIYGFRGLIGYRYVATKKAIPSFTESSTWYDYFKYPKIGVNIQKFKGPYDSSGYNNPFSVGLGAILGTTADQGKVIALRAMLIMSVPSLFMIEARAYILDKLPSLDDGTDPPFWAFIAFGENSLEIGMGVDYVSPKLKGTLLELHANAHAFFPVGSGNKSWFINIGTKENPNTAILFKGNVNLNVSAYLLLASQGIEFGAKVDYDLRKNFFGIKVHLWAYIEIGAKISFERNQFGGYLHFGGGIEINVWRIIYIGFELNCYLSAEAVKPFLIYAEMTFRGRIKIAMIKIKFNLRLQLKWEKDNELNLNPVPVLDNGLQDTIDRRRELVKGVHMLTNEEFEIELLNGLPAISEINKYIPLDTYIDIKFSKAVIPNKVDNFIGGHTSGAVNFIDLIPPEKTVKGGKVLRQVPHKYSIESIEIKACTDTQSTWVDYNPYQAIKPSLTTNVKLGYWQRSGNQYDAIRLLANTPFSYIDAGEPGWFIPEQYGITASNLFCSESIDMWHTSNVLNKTTGDVYPITGQTDGYEINGAYYYPIGDFDVEPNNEDYIPFNTFKITNDLNTWLFDKSISISNANGLAIILPEDSVKVRIKLNSTSQNVKVKFYKTADLLQFGPSNTGFVLVSELNITAANSTQEIVYENLAPETIVPIIKIEIIPSSPQLDAINSIREQILALYTDSYSSAATSGADPIINISLPNNLILYNQLVEQLNQLMENTCLAESLNNFGDFNTDSELCDLVRDLQKLHCFDFIYDKISVVELDQFNNFFSILKIFIANFPLHSIGSQNYYLDFQNTLLQLNEAFNNSSQETIMALYNELYDNAQNLINELIRAGKCNIKNRENCTTSFQEIKWKTVSSYEYEETIPSQEAVNSELQAMQQAVTHNVQPIWRPNTIYYIHFVLKDTIANISTDGVHYYYGFRTAGPLGHFHDANGVNYGNELNAQLQVVNRKDKNDVISALGKLVNPDKYALTSLRNYIDYQRSYPNADSNLLQFKPLFFGENQCRIDLFFVKPFTYHMFNDWPTYNGLNPIKGTINIAIKDPIADVIIPYPLPVNYSEQLVPVPENQNGTSHWTDDNDPRLPIGIRSLINLMANGVTDCNIQLGEPLSPMSYAYSVKLTKLKPQKLYTVIVSNAFDKDNDGLYTDYEVTSRAIYENENKEVHKFVFQTSRYDNFTEQVNSYILNENKKAIFKIEKPLTNDDITKAYAIVSKTNSNIDTNLAEVYLDLFDRVFEGIFKIKPLDPPVTTEFNLIKDQNTGAVIAILVRNPEPFNNPRIPMTNIQDTIQVMNSNNSNAVKNENYKILHSKDYSQAIIMHNSLQITQTLIPFQFQYKIWNGTAYVVETSNALSKVNLELLIN